MIKRAVVSCTEYVSRLNRKAKQFDNPDVNKQTEILRKRGFVILDHLVGTDKFKAVQQNIKQRFEQDFDIDFPCFGQSFIDAKRDDDLIKKNFAVSKDQLINRKLTFERKDIQSYEQMVKELRPSTLTLSMPSNREFYDLWLDSTVTQIISNYMGFVPELTEAYIRRNFPCSYKVMNHNWHRDTNHETHLLKAFIFFTDCDINTGAHHYIAGSVHDPRYRDKVYFTDDEINSIWPIGSDDHMVSTVPAGTIIIEDTRGLHKAGIPKEAYRDLGFAVFLPPNHFKKSTSFYGINMNTFNSLGDDQKRFIPSNNVRIDH